MSNTEFSCEILGARKRRVLGTDLAFFLSELGAKMGFSWEGGPGDIYLERSLPCSVTFGRASGKIRILNAKLKHYHSARILMSN